MDSGKNKELLQQEVSDNSPCSYLSSPLKRLSELSLMCGILKKIQMNLPMKQIITGVGKHIAIKGEKGGEDKLEDRG